MNKTFDMILIISLLLAVVATLLLVYMLLINVKGELMEKSINQKILDGCICPKNGQDVDKMVAN